MAGINFDVTVNSSSFVENFKRMQDTIHNTSKMLERTGLSIDEIETFAKRTFGTLAKVGKNFNVEGAENQIVALTKVIRDNEAVLIQSKERIAEWAKQAEDAQRAGDSGLFKAITDDIKAEAASMQSLIAETKDYRLALEEVRALNSLSGGNTAPMLFNTQEEYEHVQLLRQGIAELLSQIANFDGSDEGLLALRQQLSGINEELRQSELAAAENAAALGEQGTRAAEASTKLYELNKAVEQQTGVVAELSNKLYAAAEALEQAESGGDTSSIDDAQIKYDELSEALQSAKMHLINLQTEQKKAQGALGENAGAQSMRTQLRQVTVEIAELTMQYRAMSNEEKNSSQGKELARKLQDLTQKAGVMRDAMADANRAIGAIASDTHNFDAMAGGLQLVNSAFGAATGAAAMFGVKQEELADIQTKLQASLAISNALSQIQNNVQKESAVMMGIAALQKKAATVAENLDTTAKGKNIIVTKAATVAQAAFNAVAKANPYVLLASAIITVVGALAIFAKGQKEASEAEKQRQQAAEDAKKSYEEYESALSNSYANMMSKYSSLRREWKSLSTSHQKTKWIKDNKKSFEELGLSVSGIKDAEDVFRNNTQKVVYSFKRRAEAAALAAQMTDLYRKQMDIEQKASDRLDTLSVQAYDRVPDHISDKGMTRDRGADTFNGGRYGLNSQGQYYFLAKGADEYNRSLWESDEQLKGMNDQWKGINQQINTADERLKKLGSTTSTTTPKPTGGSGNTATDATKVWEERMKQQRDATRRARDLELSTRQAEIDIMQEGTEKTLAQMELDRDKEIEAVKRSYEDIRLARIEAAKRLWEQDLSNKGKNFYESETYKQASQPDSPNSPEYSNMVKRMEAVNVAFNRRMEEMQAQQRQGMYDYLKEYGSIQEQRLSIQSEYDEKIAKEQDVWRQRALEMERDGALSALDMRELQENIDWEQVFSDLGTQSVKYLEDLKSKLKTALDAKDITAENAKVLSEKIREIEDAITEKTDVWASLLPGLRERKRLTEEAASAESEYESALSKEAEAINRVLDTKKQIKAQLGQLDIRDALGQKISIELEAISEENKESLLSSLDKDSDLYKGLLTLFENLAADSSQVNKAHETTTKAKTKVDQQWDKLKGMNGLTDVFSWAQGGNPIAIVQGIEQNARSLAETVDKVGLGGTDFGEAVHNFADGVGGFSSAIQSLASGDIFGAINGIVDGFQGFGHMFERIGGFSFNGSNAAEVMKTINRNIERNEILGQSIDRLNDTMSGHGGSKAIETYAKMAELQKELEKNLQESVRLQMSYHEAHHSFDHYWEREFDVRKVLKKL